MAQKSYNPRDVRSESERVKTRAHGLPSGQEESGEPLAPEKFLKERVLLTLQGGA